MHTIKFLQLQVGAHWPTAGVPVFSKSLLCGRWYVYVPLRVCINM